MGKVDRALIRDVAAIAAAAGVIGISFGAIAVAAGLSVWIASLMSLLVFAGGSQFMFVGIVAGGGSPVAAVFAGLLLNARHLPFGLVVSDVLGRSWPMRLLGTHLMVDESVAFALAQQDPARRRAAYWLCGGALFVAWNVGVLVGALAGQSFGNPDALGLDAAFPAGMLALLLPSLMARSDEKAAGEGGAEAAAEAKRKAALARRVALVGALIALVTTPLLPAGVPVLLALLALAVALR
ncbi:AzlC family ABC transporter permease [Pyxidicoccus fallax]|uniref:Branched-chain amino acid ABC transporter permease n=1 Tax=Pyxidicoccus fallax TaxID=394095 RepID=A0A848LBD6_9BACT|nr:AzlC family ABC transporter permease [Pyxidicoccus fallax]NMO14155.1 branched-chain amino acid ABC transporter permease [Pyxidicoccus fallax]NPC81500.1 AzlC family ABC transporter permease [Pyxidicoccus fallax]